MTSPTTYKLGFPKLKYSVVPMASGAPFSRDPTTSDLFDPKVGGYYKIGTCWPNQDNGTIWFLTSITGGNTANWAASGVSPTGDVVGPASATDNALARFNLTTGKLIQNSVGILSDTGVLTGITQMGIGIAPTAVLGLAAGTATAGTAPLKFAAGTNLTSPEAGAVEYDGTHLFYTTSTPTRLTLTTGPSSSTDNRLTRMNGTAGAIQEATNTTLSDADVMAFPAGGGVTLTTGGGAARKGTFTLIAGDSGDIATTSVLTGSALAITITALGTVTAPQALYATITNGSKFVITSADATDTSSGTWAIVG